ncbi:MAG: hypothetical protein KAV87_66320 [Desulfobacteraceae bacterium]|nr:hypothetical protein [Desulfobacteraceae bacterium]
MPLEDSPNKFKTERYDLITDDIAAPGAGNPVSWNVPDNRVITVVSVTFQFATSVVVADRWVWIAVQTGGVDAMCVSPVMQLQPANTTITYYMTKGIAPIDLTAVVGMIVGPLACGTDIKAGEQLVIVAENIDVGDVFSAVRVRYCEWTED